MTEPRPTPRHGPSEEERTRPPAIRARAGLRIAYLHPGSVPSLYANSVHAMRMCDAFAAAGHVVTLYTAPGTYTVDDAHAYYGVRHRFAVRTVPSPDYTPDGYRVRAEQVRSLLTRETAPDLIYGHDLYALTAAARIAPLVYETHRLRDDPHTLSIEQRLLRDTPPARIVVITHALGHDYRRTYGHLGALPIVVAPEAAEDPRASTRPADPPPMPGRPGAPRIGYVGHLYEGRGIELVLAMAARFPDHDVHLVGGAPEDLDRWRRRGGPKNAYFHGHQPPGAVDAYYPLFDVVLAPYQAKVYTAGGHCETGRWASPMKIFEYMAHGRAIIASDLPVLREVLRDGATCLLRPHDDPDAWAQALRRLVADGSLRRSLGDAARRQFLDCHTWHHRARRVLAGLDTADAAAPP
ncbi:glycosyltransferase WbuB [Streptomyces subrutilus]|uniref:D-inositol 3-phosphate glycosyltransferase n=1 Tax=Streptomyces subrutilus TaxID=36818 RepID=A0A5P2UDS0_9ACTN|nr:glycosyltransferase family 4 protein [Streptomyces subrutilus]QEU77108.1 glycosyltransferase [Streptomyces subrutilus]GGZ86640.1 glycosyltransferase WbuB [Streptomyces subrutilus]